MGVLCWAMMGIAIWHFAIFIPDRFWGGIVGAFLAAAFGAVIVGFVLAGFSVPGDSEISLLTAFEGVPGAVLGLGLAYFVGVRQGNEPVHV
jgi:hypothetical protein